MVESVKGSMSLLELRDILRRTELDFALASMNRHLKKFVVPKEKFGFARRDAISFCRMNGSYGFHGAPSSSRLLTSSSPHFLLPNGLRYESLR